MLPIFVPVPEALSLWPMATVAKSFESIRSPTKAMPETERLSNFEASFTFAYRIQLTSSRSGQIRQGLTSFSLWGQSAYLSPLNCHRPQRHLKYYAATDSSRHTTAAIRYSFSHEIRACLARYSSRMSRIGLRRILVSSGISAPRNAVTKISPAIMPNCAKFTPKSPKCL